VNVYRQCFFDKNMRSVFLVIANAYCATCRSLPHIRILTEAFLWHHLGQVCSTRPRNTEYNCSCFFKGNEIPCVAFDPTIVICYVSVRVLEYKDKRFLEIVRLLVFIDCIYLTL